jgi:hypothetical protein
MYDPTIGRWISEDPLGFEARDSNLYRYVENSTPNAADPSGLEQFTYRRLPNGGITIINPQTGRPLGGDGRTNPPFPIPGAPQPAPIPCAPGGLGGLAGLWPPTKATLLQNSPFRPANTAPTPLPPGAQLTGGRPPGTPNGVGAGTGQFFPSPLPPNTYAGTGGCQGSIGVIITSPAGTAVFHFGAVNSDVAATIGQFRWPPGSHAVICGISNDPGSRNTARNVINALSSAGIRIDGISDSSNIWIGPDGKWYVNTNPGN